MQGFGKYYVDSQTYMFWPSVRSFLIFALLLRCPQLINKVIHGLSAKLSTIVFFMINIT